MPAQVVEPLVPAVTPLHAKFVAMSVSHDSVLNVPGVVSVTVTAAPATVAVTPMGNVVWQLAPAIALWKFDASVLSVALRLKVPVMALVQAFAPGAAIVGVGFKVIAPEFSLHVTVPAVMLVTVVTAPPRKAALTLVFAVVRFAKHGFVPAGHWPAMWLIAAARI